MRDSKDIHNFGILIRWLSQLFFYYPEKANSSDKICICPESNHGVVWQYYIHVEHARSGGKINCFINSDFLPLYHQYLSCEIYDIFVLCMTVHIASFIDINTSQGKFWRSVFWSWNWSLYQVMLCFCYAFKFLWQILMKDILLLWYKLSAWDTASWWDSDTLVSLCEVH